MEEKKSKKSNLFAALGAATGLGNALRFPHLVSVYGYSFFVAYVVSLALICFPVLTAELNCSKRGDLPVFIQRAAAVNSLIIALYYILITSKLTASAVSFSIFARPDGKWYFTLFAVLALCFVIIKRGKLSLSGRASVICFFGLFIYLAIRGGLKISLPLGNIFSGSLWVDALGQSFLSLSLAAGVMPAFAKTLDKSFSAAKTAAKIIAVNLLGCVLSALGTLPFADGGEGGGLVYAFTVYPRIVYAISKTPFTSRLTGGLVYGALGTVALHSTCSLTLPAVSQLKLKPIVFVILGALLCPLFAYGGGEVMSACDKMTCSVVAVCIALGECVCFVFAEKNALKRIYMGVICLLLAAFCVLSLCSVRFSGYSTVPAVCAFLCLVAIPCAVLYAEDFKKSVTKLNCLIDNARGAYYNKNGCDRN